MCHLDIIRDLAVPLSARLLADLFYLDLRTDENPNGSLGAAELYRHLLNLRIWGLNNTDPAQAWNRRRRAQESVRVIIDSTLRLVRDVARSSRSSGLSISAALSGLLSRGHGLKEGSLRSCGHRLVEELLAQNDSPEHVVDNLWLSAFGGAGIAVNSFHEVLSFFLDPEHADLWAQVQDLAGKDDDDALRAYVVEAQRLTNPQRNVRIATQPDELEGKKIQPGNLVVLMLGEAGRNPADVPDADKFDAHRQPAPVKPFSYGQHACLFEGLALEFLTGLIKLAAGLGELRPAPGPAGQVKRIRVGPEMLYLNDSWSDLAFCISS
ncbi:hypothetical protein CDD83_6231 [Cordyceps sp. RAO-2017]|nr:hypothetical protein CDD83_6231 [Cordyceps sp. RAO-2017]